MTAELTFHPLANIFPLVDGEAFEALVADVRNYGLNEPIILHEGQILDGRNRYRACVAAGVDVRMTQFVGTDPLAFVISKNLHRRHLNEAQRSMVAKKLATMRQGRPADKPANLPVLPEVSQDEAAKMLNVSPRSVRHAAIVIDKGAPELAQAVERGAISVSTAAQLVDLPKARQREIAAAGKAAAGKAAKQMRARRQSARAPTELLAKETEHDRDLRFLRGAWEGSCESARAAFLRDLGIELKAVA